MADLLAATSGGGGEVEPNAKGETLMHIAAAAPNSDRCLQILLHAAGPSRRPRRPHPDTGAHMLQ